MDGVITPKITEKDKAGLDWQTVQQKPMKKQNSNDVEGPKPTSVKGQNDS